MKIATKMIFFGILSMLVGTAFASPLLVSELEIRPGPGLPDGPKAEFSVDVVYANFSAQDYTSYRGIGDVPPFPFSEADAENLSAVSYFAVLNITNYSDRDAVILDADFRAAGEIYTDGNGGKGTHGGTWWAEGAWLDGEWVNVTYFPSMQLENGTWIDAYLQEGVYIQDEYSNADNSLITTYLYIDGSWVDVTGRINVTRNNDDNLWVSIRSDLLVSSHNKFTGRRDDYNATAFPFHWNYIWSGPEDFNNTWAPHESRLIALTGTQILKKDADGIKELKKGNLTVHTTIRNYIPFDDPPLDTSSLAKELKQIQLEITEEGYTYNTILSEDQTFVTDAYGVEVFIDPRN